jgi:hypothetical protein
MKTQIDLGDELLAEIIDVVRKSPLPVHRKLKALVRAGKIGEMNLGQFSDECAEIALSSISSAQSPLIGASPSHPDGRPSE